MAVRLIRDAKILAPQDVQRQVQARRPSGWDPRYLMLQLSRKDAREQAERAAEMCRAMGLSDGSRGE